MSDMPEAQAALLHSLDALEAQHRRSIYVKVVGKGRKVREAPFSIDLVRDLLQIWRMDCPSLLDRSVDSD
jgi:hypothetical protein